MTITLPDESATMMAANRLAHGIALAGQLAELPVTIYLRGDLGAGKTTLVRGVLMALGYEGRVKSPTYALVEVYRVSSLNLYHFDFYRLRDPNEWHEAGFRDSLTAPAISLIEWPEKAFGARVPLPPPDLEIQLTSGQSSETARSMRLTARSTLGQKLLKALLS
ncbi:MAG: tRNA (adenosine(37)-N6)-threonylcarbamoyltransferase complex ATPase subunit type 1 TsaE [Rhodocyclaceae bacterium]|nr:tRNA (adenosine(37)-N6)-threonylcarbamoyltransferase complex ATPase subunit type 1 TsaE [Rhodocyclaceae bacterium]